MCLSIIYDWLHVQQPDGLKQEDDGYVTDEDYVNDGGQDDNDGSQEELGEVEPVVVKRKKSIKERLDPLPDKG